VKCDSNEEINKSYKSQIMSTQLGVPQGSVWGVDLFGVTTNDVIDFPTKADMTAYADDLSGTISSNSETELINNVKQTITEIKEICNSKRLLLHPSKTVYIQFHTHRKIPDKSYLFHVENTSIERVNHAKLLGIFIDEELNWNVHVNYICSKLNSSIFVLYTLRNRVLLNTLLLIYHAHIYSHVHNSIIFWGSHKCHLIRIFKIQKRALRTIKRLTSRNSCKPVFKELKLLTIPCIYIFWAIMYRKLHPEEYISNEQIHNYNTRNKSKTVIPKHTSNIIEKSPQYNSAKFYDFLPKCMRNIVNITLFKNLLKKVLIHKLYYEVESFFHNETKIIEADILLFVKKSDLDDNSVRQSDDNTE
jgi:hypothetical protein